LLTDLGKTIEMAALARGKVSELGPDLQPDRIDGPTILDVDAIRATPVGGLPRNQSPHFVLLHRRFLSPK
jgi:hypothetical protein